MTDTGRQVSLTRRPGRGAQVRQARAGSWTKDRREAFLAELAMTSNVRASARVVGMSEQGAYKLRRKDAAFRVAWGEALAEGYSKLELLLLERALFGTEKVVVKGGEIAKVREYSDRLALSLLSAHRAAAKGDAIACGDTEDIELVRERIVEKLRVMRRRLTAADDAD